MFLHNSLVCSVCCEYHYGTCDLVQDEPASCEAWKDDKDVWTILQRGKLASYVEGMKGHDPNLFMKLSNSWKEGNVTVGEHSFLVNMELIVKVTSLSLDGTCIP